MPNPEAPKSLPAPEMQPDIIEQIVPELEHAESGEQLDALAQELARQRADAAQGDVEELRGDIRSALTDAARAEFEYHVAGQPDGLGEDQGTALLAVQEAFASVPGMQVRLEGGVLRVDLADGTAPETQERVQLPDRYFEGVDENTQREIQEEFQRLPEEFKPIIRDAFEGLNAEEMRAAIELGSAIRAQPRLGELLTKGSMSFFENPDDPTEWETLSDEEKSELNTFLDQLPPDQKAVLVKVGGEVIPRMVRALESREKHEGLSGLIGAELSPEEQRAIVEKGKAIYKKYQENFNSSADEKHIEYQRALCEAELMMAGVDTSGGLPRSAEDIKPVKTKFEKILGLLFGFFQYISIMIKKAKGERLGGSEEESESTEEADLMQKSLDDLNDDPGNNFARFSLRTVRELSGSRKHLDGLPKTGENFELSEETQNQIRAIEGAVIEGEGVTVTSIHIEDVTDAKLESLRTFLQPRILEGRETVLEERAGSCTADNEAGVRAALNTPGQWAEGGVTGYEYVTKGDTIVAQKLDGTETWVLENGGFVEKPGQYFDASDGQFKSTSDLRYDQSTRTWRQATEQEQKVEKGNRIRSGGESYLDGVDGATKQTGGRYFVEIPWDKDDLNVRFNEGEERWEIREQDETVWHVPGDGNLPDVWSNKGTKTVRSIDDKLKSINEAIS